MATLQLRQHPVEAGAGALIILDTLLVGGIRFVLDKLAAAVETELNDDTALREQLLAAEILARLREIRERRQGDAATSLSPADYKVSGVDASFEGDEHH